LISINKISHFWRQPNIIRYLNCIEWLFALSEWHSHTLWSIRCRWKPKIIIFVISNDDKHYNIRSLNGLTYFIHCYRIIHCGQVGRYRVYSMLRSSPYNSVCLVTVLAGLIICIVAFFFHTYIEIVFFFFKIV